MLKMMLYNFVLLLTEQDRVKRQTKGITNLILDSFSGVATELILDVTKVLRIVKLCI